MPDLGLGAVSANDPAGQMAAADKLLAAGEITAAEAAFRDILLAAPAFWQASAGLARCARRRGDREASLRFYRAAVAAHPAAPALLRLEVAADLRELGRVAAAAAIYQEMLTETPGSLPALIGLGHCARKRGDPEAALALFEAAAKEEPGHFGVRTEVAHSLRQLGRMAEAQAGYLALSLEAPGNLALRMEVGRCARQMGDRAAALAQFQAAAALDSRHAQARLEIATELQALGRWDEAATIYDEVLIQAPAQVGARIGLAHCARKRGDFAAALAQMDAAAALEPRHLWVGLHRAADLRELGRNEAAEAEYARLLALYPDETQVRMGLGQSVRKRGDRAAAMAQFAAVVRLDPAHLGARLELAADLRELNRLDAAEAAYAEVVAISPNSVPAHLGLGYCARRRGDSAAAIGHFGHAAAADPAATTALLEIAFEQRDAGEVENALRTAGQVLERRPGDFAALSSIGMTLRYAGRHEEALATFRLAHEAQPNASGCVVEMATEERTLGRQAACDELLDAAAALEPDNMTLLSRRGEQMTIAADPEETLAFYEDALSRQPGQLPLEFGRTQALANVGRMEEALARLDQLERDMGALPSILGRRLALLRVAGHYHRGLRLAREATAAAPWVFPLWQERMQAEMLVGGEADLDDCVARLPAGTAHQRAAVLRSRANIAETRGELEAAVGFYQQAVTLHPDNAGLAHELTRLHVLMLDDQEARRQLRRFCTMTAHVTRLKQKSLNISQTHYGQILDDYCLDAALLDRIKAARPLPPAPRIAALLQIVAENPDSTAAAVTLMLALREAGVWDRQPEMRGGGGIPKQIVQFWDTDAPPHDVADIMQSWRQLNPEHEIRLFNETTARAFLARVGRPVQLAFARVREPAQKADILRLAVLAVEGGIYADADDRCLRPIDTIVPADAALMMYQEDHATIGNNFIAAAPRHPVLIHALGLAVGAINRGDSDMVWLSTGPALLTRTLAQMLAANVVTPADLGGNVVMLRRRELFQAVAIHCSAGYKRTAKHWSNSTFAQRRTPVRAG